MGIESRGGSALASPEKKDEVDFMGEFSSTTLHAWKLWKDPAASREDMETALVQLEEKLGTKDVQRYRLPLEDEAWDAYVGLASRLNRPLNFDYNSDDGNIVPLNK